MQLTPTSLSGNLKLQLIELCGSLQDAKDAFEWVSEVPEAAPVPAPVEGCVGLTDDEVLKLDAEALKDLAMQRLAEKQNAGVEVKS